MPSIFNQPGSAPVVQYNSSIVETAEEWGDWQFLPYLVCNEAEIALAPDTGRATFDYRTGFIAPEDDPGNPSQFDPVDLVDQYVRVSIQQPFSDPVPVFWGIFSSQTTVSMSTTNAAGPQNFQAQGIEYLLDRCPIAGSKAIKPNPSGGSPTNVTVSLNTAMSFNRKPTKGKVLVGNRSKNLGPDGVYMFSGYGAKWTNLQIANHLLQYWGPDNVTFQLVGQTDPLDQMIAYHDFKEGTTLWKALCQLIDHRKGLIMIPYVGDDGTVYIYVDTVQDVPIQVAGLTIPPNSNPVQFTLPSSPPYDQMVDDVPISKTDQTNYGNIIVQGALVKMMFPASFYNSPAWQQLIFPPDQGNLLHAGDYYQTQYLTGVPGGNGTPQQNDTERAKDKYKDVFQRFKVDYKWDGKLINSTQAGGNGKPVNTMPIPYPDGTIDITPPDGAKQQLPTDVPGAQFVFFDRLYYKRLPIRQGVDYTQIPPVDNNPDPNTAEHVPMFALYYDKDNGANHMADTMWHKIERFNKDNKAVKSLTLHKADTELGVHIEATPNHYLALNHFQNANPTNTQPELDYTNLVVVGAMDVPCRPTVFWQSPFGGNRTKIAVLPSCRFMFATPGCPLDVDNNGKLVTMPADDDGSYNPIVLDDDHTVLQQIAVEMAAWFGAPRQTIKITIKQPGVYVPLGSFLEQMNTAYSTEPIGTLINKISINFDTQETTIQTGFESLDYVHLLGRAEDLDEEEVAQ
ncbi:MAG TPA: hypothetical protein VFG04_14100 [Planctomycetaceae bacterium]|jgi:hypothetical protein|nr:hypothetical protein [Planctomycetaceae bacterium]